MFKKIVPLLILIAATLACEISGVDEPLPTVMVLPTPAPTLPPTVTPIAAATPTTLPTTPTAAPTSVPSPIPTESGLRPKEVGQIRLNDPSRLIWSVDGKTLGALTQNSASVYDAATLSGIVTYNTPNTALTILDLSLETETVLTTVDRKNIDVRKYGNGQVVRTLRLTTPALSASFVLEGKTVAVASGERIAVDLWEVATGKQGVAWRGFQTAAPVYSFVYAPDGKTLIWISRGTVQLMDIATSKMGMKVSHEDFVGAVAMTNDGKLLATLSATTVNKQLVGLVKLVEAENGNEIAKLIQLKGTGLALAFSPDGKYLAVGADKTITVWDVATHKEAANIAGHTDRLTSLAFSPDGRTLVSASNDDTIRFWRLP